MVFGCPRSGRHGSELSDSAAACGVQSDEPHAVSCNHVALESVSNPDRSAMSKMTSCTEAAPGWHSLCQQPAYLQWSHWHLLQNKYCLGFSIIYPPWPAMTQQRYNFELCISSFPQPRRTSKRTWVIYLKINIHCYFRKPGVSMHGICMGLAGMTKDLWKISVFQSDRWETERILQPSSYRTRCLFLGNWMSWEPAHSWSHLNTGA